MRKQIVSPVKLSSVNIGRAPTQILQTPQMWLVLRKSFFVMMTVNWNRLLVEALQPQSLEVFQTSLDEAQSYLVWLIVHPALVRRLGWRTPEIPSKLNHPGILSIYRQWRCCRNLVKFRTWPGILNQNSPAPLFCVVSHAVVPLQVFAGLVIGTLHKELQPWGLHSSPVTSNL